MADPFLGYRHYFLECPRLHGIEIPRPIRLETDGDFREIAKANRRAVFACPWCGFVSAYYGQDIREILVAGIEDPFVRGEHVLVAIRVECDGEHCEAPKLIHTVVCTEPEKSISTIVPRDWYFSETALCERGHKLRLPADQKLKVHRGGMVEVPF